MDHCSEQAKKISDVINQSTRLYRPPSSVYLQLFFLFSRWLKAECYCVVVPESKWLRAFWKHWHFLLSLPGKLFLGAASQLLDVDLGRCIDLNQQLKWNIYIYIIMPVFLKTLLINTNYTSVICWYSMCFFCGILSLFFIFLELGLSWLLGSVTKDIQFVLSN